MPRAILLAVVWLTLPHAFADQPTKLTSLRSGYQSAVDRAMQPIQRTYLQELVKLSVELTKAGDLEGALAVNEEMKKLPQDLVAQALGQAVDRPVRKLTFKATIDGDDKLIVQNGKVSIEHGGWEKPEDISVNGEKWAPAWDGNRAAPLEKMSPPLASFNGETVSVRMIQGRGLVTVLEQPTSFNGQKLIVKLQDEGGGASEFDVRVSW